VFLRACRVFTIFRFSRLLPARFVGSDTTSFSTESVSPQAIRILISAWIIIGIFTVMALSATTLTGDLKGKISNLRGEILSGAELTLTDLNSGHHHREISAGNGYYVFPDLDEATYLLEVYFEGTQYLSTEILVAGETRYDLVLNLVNQIVVVTGTHIPTPIKLEGRSIAVVTSEEMELRQQRFVYDVLSAIPGVQVTRSGGYGALASVSIRGLDSDQTLVVQDGIVLNNPATFGNAFDFSKLDTRDIERIEVIRGAQSTLYGSDAIGGVVNIVTKEGSQGIQGSGFLEGGSFRTLQGGATVRGGNRKISGRMTLGGITTRGFSSAEEANGNTEDDGLKSLNFSGKGKYQVLDKLTLSGVFRHQSSENEFDSFLGQPVDGTEVSQSKELSLGGFATLDTNSGRLSHRGSITYSRSDWLNTKDGVPDFDSLGTRISYEYQGSARPAERTTMVFGAEYEVQEAITAIGYGGNQRIETKSGYGLVQISPHERLTINGGVRHDSSSAFGSEMTFNGAGALEVPMADLILRGSYSEGFRAPTAGELSFNGNLLAEFSRGWDVGLERTFTENRFRLGITYFDQQVDDLIAFDLAEFTFRNIQNFETSGLELVAGIQVHPTLWLDFGYAYLDAFNLSLTTAAGNQPDNRLTVEVAWRPTHRITLSLGTLFNGEEHDGSTVLSGYTLVNLRGSYKLAEGLDFIIRMENVTDANYQDNLGFGTAPLSVFAGFRRYF
jgi:vitamin B12 transporter